MHAKIYFFKRFLQDIKLAKNLIMLNENRRKSMIDPGRSKNIPKCQVPKEHNGRLWLINFEGFSPIQSIRLIKSHKRTARL